MNFKEIFKMEKISIRQAKTAIPGLLDLCTWIEKYGDKTLEEMRMAEIGSFVGDSTKVFAKRFKEVVSVDPYLNGYDKSDPSSENWPMEQIFAQFKEDVLDKFDNVIHHHTTSEEGSKLFADASFDFVYIDANHLYEFVKLDLKCWLPKVKRPGWIGGHDFQHKWAPGVKPAVLEMVHSIDNHFQETSWIKRLI